MDNPELTPPKTGKSSSPRFPFIDLSTAIDKTKVVWEKEGKHPTRTGALAAHWELSEKSSGLRSYVAALGYFGLLEQVGSGEYKLSDRALKILAGDSEERAKALREAALQPKIYRKLWERFNGELPSDANLEARLLIDYGFNRDSVTGFIKNFRSTLALAKMDKSDNLEDTSEGQIKMPTAQAKGRLDGLIASSTKPHMTQGLRYLSIPLEIGDAPVPLGMSKKDWEIFINTLKVWKNRIVDSSEEAPDDSALDELAED